MKIPVEWLKQYIKTDKSTEELARSFTLLGLMLDKPVSEYHDGKYQTDVLDLEHRMDRSDWLSITGCARDLAAFERVDFIFPELYTREGKKPEANQIVDIKVDCPDMVNRFNTRVFRNIRVGDSPDWLKNRLQAYGIPSINNIVDITNYVMVETGQPMHAQDLAKLKKQEIVIRKARKGEKMVTLLGETVELDEGNFVLTQNDIPTVLGGIVGGQSTGIEKTTTDIVLDAGNYNQVVIRKASRRLKIQNETVLRYDKFLHPDLTELAIHRATKLILDLAGGIYYSNIDWYPNPQTHKKFILRMERLEKLSGMRFVKDAVKEILVRLGYIVLNEDEHFIEVKIPYFRTDIEVEDDIVADILRINNYTNIPSAMMNTTPPTEITPEIYKFEEKVRHILVNLGAHEHITDPLLNFDPKNKNQIVLENSQSEEKNSLRINIADTLNQVIDVYQKNKIKEIKIFEIGKTYFKENLLEQREIQTIVRFDTLSATADQTKKLLRGLLEELGINNYSVVKTDKGLEISANYKNLGFIAHNGFRLFTENLMKIASTSTRAATLNPNTLYEDVSVVIPVTETVGELYNTVYYFDPAITDLDVKTEKLSDQKKNVIFRIYYNENNFGPIKQKLIEKLKTFPDLEMRS